MMGVRRKSTGRGNATPNRKIRGRVGLAVLAAGLGSPATTAGSHGASPPCATEASACETLNPEQSSAAAPLRRTTGKPRLLEFVSEGCAACARMAPIVTELVKRCEPGDAFLAVDISAEGGAQLARLYRVSAVPTFLSVDADGREVERLVGQQSPRELATALGEVQEKECS